MYADIVEAYGRIHGFIKHIPLYYSNIFSEKYDGSIYFKLESLQRTGSFKIRGALNAMLKNPDRCKGGVVTASAGNHAQGVAFGAQMLGVSATIVMPIHTPLVKIQNTEGYGATVVLHGKSFDEAYSRAVEISESENAYLIHPFNDEDVIAGQGTIAHEIWTELQNVDQIVVPIGGGGLCAGIATYMKHVAPTTRIIGVQAENAAGMVASLRAGRIVRLSSSATIAEGIAVKGVGDKTFDLLKDRLDDIITVSENEIASAVLAYMEKSKLVVEGAGATPLSLILSGKLDVRGKTTVLAVSGGNIDVNLISRIISQGLASSGRFAEITVTLKDVPGTLAEATGFIAAQGANILDIRHVRSATSLLVGFTRVTFDLETRGYDHVQQILSAMTQHGYDVTIQ